MTVLVDSRRDFTLENFRRVAYGGEGVQIGQESGPRTLPSIRRPVPVCAAREAKGANGQGDDLCRDAGCHEFSTAATRPLSTQPRSIGASAGAASRAFAWQAVLKIKHVTEQLGHVSPKLGRLARIGDDRYLLGDDGERDPAPAAAPACG
jgi:hypothetical protein